MRDVLNKQDTLEFEKAKVKELDEILQDSFNGFSGNSVVLAGTERARKTLAESHSATNLSSRGN